MSNEIKIQVVRTVVSRSAETDNPIISGLYEYTWYFDDEIIASFDGTSNDIQMYISSGIGVPVTMYNRIKVALQLCANIRRYGAIRPEFYKMLLELCEDVFRGSDAQTIYREQFELYCRFVETDSNQNDTFKPTHNTTNGKQTWDIQADLAMANEGITKEDMVFWVPISKHFLRMGRKSLPGLTLEESKLIDAKKVREYLDGWINKMENGGHTDDTN